MVGLLFVGAGVAIGVTLLRRTHDRSRTLARGLVAEARCLETYVTRDRGFSEDSLPRSRRHVILGFRTYDGRDVRIEDTSGIPRVVGDRVLVRYLPEQPQRAVVADAAAPAGQSIALVIGLVVCGGFVCVGLLVASAGLGIGFFAPSPPTRNGRAGRRSTTASSTDFPPPGAGRPARAVDGTSVIPSATGTEGDGADPARRGCVPRASRGGAP